MTTSALFNRPAGHLLHLAALGLLATCGSPLYAQSSSQNPYHAVHGWENLPDGRELGVISGVFPDPDGRHLWILDRCGADLCAGSDLDPILKFDLDGNLVDSFGAGMFAWPHGFFLDSEGYLWVTEGAPRGDARGTLGESMGMGHQVFKLDQTGRVVMTLGEAGVAGHGPGHFNGPADVVVTREGDIWVADGHRGGNNRIVKFSGDGAFILEVGGGVGSESRDPGRFDDVHALALDSQGRLFVADRGNNRIQVFMDDGELAAIWTQFGKPSVVFIDHDDVLYAGDGLSGVTRPGWRSNLGWERGIRIGDAMTGWVTAFIPDREEMVGAGIEFLGVDLDGNIYAGEVTRLPH